MDLEEFAKQLRRFMVGRWWVSMRARSLVLARKMNLDPRAVAQYLSRLYRDSELARKYGFQLDRESRRSKEAMIYRIRLVS